MEYALMDTRSGKRLSMHPNMEGAKLSALFHVKNGDKVTWETGRHAPVQVAALHGKVNGKQRFRVHAY